ncbi:urease subunit beta [Neisseriaceae bacterium PsAf]|nr:urease subunit beta [Neisseriaceae bacterium PsAf]
MIPGEYKLSEDNIEINQGRKTIFISVTNKGDRPIQIGSHYHFSEVNPALHFNRSETMGYHLDIPSGNAVRFEAGETKKVQLVEFSGNKNLHGFSHRNK